MIAAMVNGIINQEAREGEAGREGGGVRVMTMKTGRALTDIDQVREREKRGRVARNTADVGTVMTEVAGREETGVGTETGTAGEAVAGRDRGQGEGTTGTIDEREPVMILGGVERGGWIST